MMDLHLTRRDDVFARCRLAVEDGVADGPVRVFFDGQHCLNLTSLHTAALLTEVENPAPRVVAWTPHPLATVGPRVAALLEARAARRAAKKAAA